MTFEPEITERLRQLEAKYDVMGQDLKSYLDGLLHADYLTYWKYVNLDALLCLQQPVTPFPDEMVFIIYHQITELYFKLTLHEMEQLANKRTAMTAEFFVARVSRINCYFRALTHSFEIMVTGMEKEQFLKFRMSLLPASGFQSAQYRMIEICATDFINLVEKDERPRFAGQESPDLTEMFEFLYWKKGATELASGKKTLTLEQFEQKYSRELIRLAENYRTGNMLALYHSLSPEAQQSDEVRLALRELDVNVNVNWPLMHYKSAVQYLQRNPSDIAATGGTNWQKYLPPRFQKRIFYPELWSEQEQEEWGRGWVESVLFPDKN